MNLKNRLLHESTKSGKIFDHTIQFLIIISLVGFTVETIPNLSSAIINILYLIEIFCVIVFTFEYLLRIFYAENKLKFIFSFWGLIDLLAILPFYINHAIDLRSIRVFRLLRLLRTLKLIEYSKALQRLIDALHSVRKELTLFSIVTSFIIYISSVGIYYFEHEAQPEGFASIFHCLWWSIATLTTVGYGDVYPITTGGKIFTSLIVIVGIGIVAIPTGLIASALTKMVDEENNKES